MKAVRVLIADDSPTARLMLRHILEADPALRIVGEASNGQEAVQLAQKLVPNLVVMDVHMPLLDGLEATKEIMMRAPTPIVIVSAADNHQDIDLSLSATQAGALLALPKPRSQNDPSFPEQSSQLRNMVKAMAQVKVVRRWQSDGTGSVQPARRAQPSQVRLVSMAASTGGPAALRRILIDLPRTFAVPILVVQHIARGFGAAFADWLSSACSLHVKLAEDREAARAGTVYVAPDDRHLGITSTGELSLSDEPADAGFRPSASHLFSTCGRSYGPGLLAVILTGMGSDGADGLRIAQDAGSFVLAQDQESSVVFGMAQEAVNRGLVDQVVPLDQMAARVIELVESGRG
jgi:two-component system chemotaxis response regulator CheB